MESDKTEKQRLRDGSEKVENTAIIMQWQMLLMLCFMVIYKQLSDAKTGTIIMLTVHGFLRKYLQI